MLVGLDLPVSVVLLGVVMFVCMRRVCVFQSVVRLGLADLMG
jgi:hypothetical protein